MVEQEQKEIFDQWLTAHKGIFFKIVRSFASTPADQEDLFQEISLAVWKSIPDFRGRSKPSTWIYRVALYTATIWARQEKKAPDTGPIADLEHSLIATEQPQDERLEWLYDQIAQFDPVDRSVCLLLLEGFSYKEIATLVGISGSHVGVKVHRIKQQLRQTLAEGSSHGI